MDRSILASDGFEDFLRDNTTVESTDGSKIARASITEQINIAHLILAQLCF